jgi:hypothetical protein
MWVVFDDAPLSGATPLRLYDHRRWDARLLAARGEVICVCFDQADYPLVLARSGRLAVATISRWSNTLHSMGYDHVLLELKPGPPRVTSLTRANVLIGKRINQKSTGVLAPVIKLVTTKWLRGTEL